MLRSLYNTIIVVRILLTWFPNPPQVIAGPLRCASHALHHACASSQHASCTLRWCRVWQTRMCVFQVRLCSYTIFKSRFGARSTLCDPYLNLFRGLIPPIGGTLDLSPILAFVVLDVSSWSSSNHRFFCMQSTHAGRPAAVPAERLRWSDTRSFWQLRQLTEAGAKHVGGSR